MSNRELSILQHLAELRRRITISVLALLVGTGVAFPFWRTVVAILVRPADDLYLIATEVTETLSVSIKVSVLAGFILAFPVILYQVIMFVAPGLNNKEKRYLFSLLPGALLAFAAGMAFCYFVLLPPALNFLIGYGGDLVDEQIKIGNIVNLIIRLLFWMGISFETPLVMYLLAQLGIVNARALGRFRRYWVVVAFILGAIITPTVDPVNQALVAVPLLVLYELGVLLARLAGRSRRSGEANVPVPHAE